MLQRSVASWRGVKVDRAVPSRPSRSHLGAASRALLSAVLMLVWGLSASSSADELASSPRGSDSGLVAAPAYGHSPELRVAQLLATQPRARVSWQPFARRPAQISGLELTVPGTTPEAGSAAFLKTWQGLLELPFESLRYARTTHAKDRHGVRYEQTWKGLKVLDRSVVVSIDDRGRVRSLASDLLPLGTPVEGPVGEAQAGASAIAAIHGLHAPLTLRFSAERVVLAEPGLALIVWRVRVPRRPLADNLVVLVDSRDGEVIHIQNRVWR